MREKKEKKLLRAAGAKESSPVHLLCPVLVKFGKHFGVIEK